MVCPVARKSAAEGCAAEGRAAEGCAAEGCAPGDIEGVQFLVEEVKLDPNEVRPAGRMGECTAAEAAVRTGEMLVSAFLEKFKYNQKTSQPAAQEKKAAKRRSLDHGTSAGPKAPAAAAHEPDPEASAVWTDIQESSIPIQPLESTEAVEEEEEVVVERDRWSSPQIDTNRDRWKHEFDEQEFQDDAGRLTQVHCQQPTSHVTGEHRCWMVCYTGGGRLLGWLLHEVMTSTAQMVRPCTDCAALIVCCLGLLMEIGRGSADRSPQLLGTIVKQSPTSRIGGSPVRGTASTWCARGKR